MTRITAIDCGSMTAPAGRWRAGDPTDRPRRIPVLVWLVELDDRRTALIDVGLHPDMESDSER
jgi:hypothetical protein